jgi:hypothetical protein
MLPTVVQVRALSVACAGELGSPEKTKSAAAASEIARLEKFDNTFILVGYVFGAWWL